jgi:hypothetical protein
MAREVVSWVGIRSRPREVVVEWPQVYRASKSPGDPNDLIGLAGVSMCIAGILTTASLSRNEALGIFSYTPATWAGQLPKSKVKKIASPRGKRIEAALTVDELRFFKPFDHDAVDAIGIGLYHLGRFLPNRVFPGAT